MVMTALQCYIWICIKIHWIYRVNTLHCGVWINVARRQCDLAAHRMDSGQYMRTQFLIALISCLFFTGCGSEDENSLPATEYDLRPTLTDFNLSDEYRYWEIRRGEFEGPDSKIAQYNEDIYSALSESQQSQLDDVSSDTGFDAYCQPNYCPVYAVALISDSIMLIDSIEDLKAFFGTIDTPAELHRWLQSYEYRLKKYDETEYGYRVLASWDNLCGRKGQDVIDVYSDGSIVFIKEVSSEEYLGCV